MITNKGKRNGICSSTREVPGSLGHLESHLGQMAFTHQKSLTLENVHEDGFEEEFRWQSNFVTRNKILLQEIVHEDGSNDSIFSHNLGLSHHQGINMSEKSYKCGKCGKYFSCGSDLTQHQSIHTGVNPYIIRSQKVGARAKLFKCKNCGKSFSRGTHLIEHERCHTGEQPYEFNVCGKSFSWDSSLILHQRTHTEKKVL